MIQRKLASMMPWLFPLVVALLVRISLWERVPRLGLISDEGEYLAAANWLVAGRGFDWYQGYLWTRAPMYPLFVAAHLRLFGPDLRPLYISQIILNLMSVLLVFVLAKRLAPERPYVASGAALLNGLYLPFALYTQVLLSETLFIALILAATVLLTSPKRTLYTAGCSGIALGLATLTRSLALGFLPLILIWMLRSQPKRPAGTSVWLAQRQIVVLVLTLVLTIAPWTIYNSRMYGGVVLIDTSGSFNLLLGARTAHDGKRTDAQVRDVVLGMLGQPTSVQDRTTCAPFPGVLPHQAARQAAMTKEALCLIADHPFAFVQKSLTELIDLFQINYTGAERFTTGFSSGRLDPAYLLALFLLDDTLYIITLPLAVLGWALARRAERAPPLVALIGLWWVYNLAVAPLLFAINRFRLPLMPFVFVFAALAIAQFSQRPPAPTQQTVNSPQQRTFLRIAALLAALLFLVASAPYAYLEPVVKGQDSRWASYFGRYPSSIAITQIALAARKQYENDQQLTAAIQQGNVAAAQELLANRQLGPDMRSLAPALLAARTGDLRRALTLLPAPEIIAQTRNAHAAMLRGDYLRTLGDEPAALAAFSARYVDDSNPVAWAWQWLRPTPTRRINLGGNLDLGYINGCYLGEGEGGATPANYRWCTDGAQLRFPQVATGLPQTLVLRIDGRAWQAYASRPTIQVLVAGNPVGRFNLNTSGITEYALPMPAAPAGSDILITLQTPTFVPDAARYNSQQSEAVVGQVQYLGVRLDWAEVR